MLKKLNLFYLTGLITGAVAVKLDGSVHGEKSSFNGLGLSFSSKFDWSPTLSVLQKMRPRKLEP